MKSDTVIELAKNMKSIDVKTDSTNIITRLIPLGKQLNEGESTERLTIAEVNDGKIYIDDENAVEQYGIIVGTAEFDDITLPENLIKAGKKYLENNNRIKKAYSAQVLDLSIIDNSQKSLQCGNTYRFKNSFMGIDEDLRLIKRTVDIYKPFTPTVEIGDKSEKITDISIRTTQLIEYEFPKQKNETLALAKSIASSLITNATTGYVVIRPEEILIMDTDNIETATKVWRWNSGGLGYSNTGYNGEYGLAMTIDGSIVADYITSGTLRGCEILNGNGTFHVDETGKVTADNITITGGSINISTDNENADIISMGNNYKRCVISPTTIFVGNSQTKLNVNLTSNGISALNNSNDEENQNTFRVDFSNGEINTKGGVYAGGNVSAKEIHGSNFKSDGKITAGGDVEADNIYGQYIESKGNITGKEIYADNLHFKMDNGNQYSLRTYLTYLEERIDSLRGES